MKNHIFYKFSILLFCSYNLFSQNSSPVIEGAKLELISDKFEFTEGPASDKLGNIYFTDQPNNRILKWNAETDSISTIMRIFGLVPTKILSCGRLVQIKKWR